MDIELMGIVFKHAKTKSCNGQAFAADVAELPVSKGSELAEVI